MTQAVHVCVQNKRKIKREKTTPGIHTHIHKVPR